MTPPAKLSTFRLTRRVNFYETDQAGIVHFSWYLRYLEEAEHALWRAAGLSIAAPGAVHGFPRVSVSCDYRSPLRFEDECQVVIRIAAMSTKSLRYSGAITMGDTLVANLSMTIVCVTKEAGEQMRAAALPPEVLARFEVAADGVERG